MAMTKVADVRRDIARVKTVMGERSRAADNQPKA